MIDDSFNIFKRMHRSLLFPLITICELGLQVIIVIFGKNIFHVANRGLTGEQWGICFGFSAITFVVSFIVKLIPLEGFIDNLLKKEEENRHLKRKKLLKIRNIRLMNHLMNLKNYMIKLCLWKQEEKRKKEIF